MSHPLTYEVFGEIRSTVDEPGDGVIAYMRAAADWQLEQVIEQWEDLYNSNMTDTKFIREFYTRLKEMRPPTD